MNTTKSLPATAEARDELMEFYRWYAGRFGFGIPASPFDAFSKVGRFTGLTLYRSKPFQVQLWLCEPNAEIYDHSHPHVDSLQIYVAGQVYLRLNGQPVLTPEILVPIANGIASHNGRWIRVRPTDTHGATIGPVGGAFMTFQHWVHGEPQSVENDWEGQPLDAEHAMRLNR